MKLEILKEPFRKAINSCEKITRKTSVLPVLQNVLIKAEGNFTQFTTTNLETTIIWNVLSKVSKKGQAAVPATFLANVVNLVQDEKICLEEKEQNLLLSAKDQETQIQGQDPNEFPIIPKINRNESWDIDIIKIITALAQVVDVPAISQIRPEISGVYFSVKAGQLKLAATDSFRLAEKTIKLEKDTAPEQSFILPQAAAKEIITVFSQEQGNISVFYNPNQILFETASPEPSQSQISVLSRLIEGNYPNYQEIIPKKFVNTTIFNKDDLAGEIKKAGLFASRSYEVQLKILPKEGKVKFFSQNAQAGKSESVLACKSEGENVEVAFNYRFLLDGLNSMKSSEVILEISANEGPGLLKPVGDNSFVYILMPIKA